MQNQDSKSIKLGLQRQLITRFTMVLFFSTITFIIATASSYQALRIQSHSIAADNSARNISQNFKQIILNWENAAVKLKTQIDFMRLLAGHDPNRWFKLHAYLTALEGSVKNFDTLLILYPDGSLAYANGPNKEEARENLTRILSEKWHRDNDGHSIQMVIKQSIWLGDDGQGTMLFLRPLENTTLVALSSPNIELSLVSDGNVIASSKGLLALNGSTVSSPAVPNSRTDDNVEQRSFPLSEDKPVQVKLVMRQTFEDPLSPPSIIITAIGLLAAFALILWLVLGRWVQQITTRIKRLSKASILFSEKNTADESIYQLLDPPIDLQDEITEVSIDYLKMMQKVEQHQEDQQAYIQTLNMLEEGVIEIDRDGYFLRASPGWLKLSSCEKNRANILFNCIHSEDVQVLSNQITSLFSGEKLQVTGRTRLAQSNGQDVWIEYRLVSGITDSEGIQSVRDVMRDITQSYLLEKRITSMALHDALTGLPNRILLEDRCELAFSVADRMGYKIAIGFIDLDHFKNVNDTFGHKTGDRLLITIAESLKQALRSGDTLARWGGDEFIVLLPDLPNLESARHAAQKIIETCAAQILLDDNEFNVTFSIGMALYPDDAKDVETLLSQADRAMFHAKERGRNNIQFFCDMTSKGLGKKDVYIQNKLSAAIKNNQIQTWFQPLVDAKTKKIIGLESLARWHDEEYGWIPPTTFIPMAENLGLIMELGEQVWLETLRQGQHWRKNGFNLQLAVNISRRQLFMPSFTNKLLESLNEFDIPASSIVLEITESIALTDIDYTAKRLQELSDAGFILSIDDFGTGYSSLSQLHDMPAKEIKIDISFVERVHEPQGAELMQAILHMSEAYGLHSVAEGVEDDKSAAILTEYGVKYLQGFLFGKPMPSHEIDQLLNHPKQLMNNN